MHGIRKSIPPPFWARSIIPPEYDLALLRPASLSKAKRFETEQDCRERLAGLAHLRNSASPQIQEALDVLETCKAKKYCGQTGCPRCGRGMRRWLFAQISQVMKPGKCEIVTIGLSYEPGGALSDADPSRLLKQLRVNLDRDGFRGANICGGLEAAWHSCEKEWRVHVHLCVHNAAPEAMSKLAARYASKKPDSIVCQPLRDRTEQLSYLLKFLTGHRPGKQFGNKRAKLIPLPTTLKHELLEWWISTPPQHFIFIYGGKRRGARIEWL